LPYIYINVISNTLFCSKNKPRETSCPKTGSGAKNLSLDELDDFIVLNFCSPKLKKVRVSVLEKIILIL